MAFSDDEYETPEPRSRGSYLVAETLEGVEVPFEFNPVKHAIEDPCHV